MSNDQGIIQRIAEAAGNAVQAIAVKTGLSSESKAVPVDSKASRRARQKAAIARVAKAAKTSKRSPR